MTNKNYRKSKSKKKLDQLQRNGKKEVIWSLSPDQVEFLSRYFLISPFLYTIRTRRFQNIRNIKNQLLKEIHYSCKKGKEFITKSLKKEELEVLKRNGVSVRVVKYKIRLN